MKITNQANLPEPIVQAVIADPYPHGKTGDISATALIGPPQIRMLKREHWSAIEEDASDRIWALLGQAVHAILERAAKADGNRVHLIEERLFAVVEGWQISGQFDRAALIETSGAWVLQDYKVTGVMSIVGGIKPEWEAQLNVLRWLLHMHGHKIDRLEVVPIFRDWFKSKAKHTKNYPPAPSMCLPVPAWDLEKTEAYIIERVRLHQKAEQGIAIECTPEERWERKAAWAVKKPNRKTALRVFDNEQQAQELAEQTPGGYVEYRPGESVRCAQYCSVRDFCQQWARMNNED